MMMLPGGTSVRIHIAAGVTDMRKGMDGLAMLVEGVLKEDPFSGHLFAFRGRKANLIKIVFWDGNGLCLFTKRLDQGGFIWPQAELERSTLAGWVGGACWWLEALHEKLAQNILSSDHLFADDTPLPVLDPGRQRTKTGRLWVYARDQRGWAGSDPPAAIYFYEPDRKAERPKEHLKAYKGTLHVDGGACPRAGHRPDPGAGFEQLTAKGDIVLAACWAHARRKFYEIAQSDGSPIAVEAVRRIAELYAVDAKVRGMEPTERVALRRAMTRPLVESLKSWLEAQLPRIPQRGKLAEATRYALARWAGLTRFLDDGRVELDTNPVERAIRPVALGRKNHLFAGSDRGARRWATVISLVETAKLNQAEPYAYIADVLQRMVDGHLVNRLDELLPWNWKAENPVKR